MHPRANKFRVPRSSLVVGRDSERGEKTGVIGSIIMIWFPFFWGFDGSPPPFFFFVRAWQSLIKIRVEDLGGKAKAMCHICAPVVRRCVYHGHAAARTPLRAPMVCPFRYREWPWARRHICAPIGRRWQMPWCFADWTCAQPALQSTCIACHD